MNSGGKFQGHTSNFPYLSRSCIPHPAQADLFCPFLWVLSRGIGGMTVFFSVITLESPSHGPSKSQ